MQWILGQVIVALAHFNDFGQFVDPIFFRIFCHTTRLRRSPNNTCNSTLNETRASAHHISWDAFELVLCEINEYVWMNYGRKMAKDGKYDKFRKRPELLLCLRRPNACLQWKNGKFVISVPCIQICVITPTATNAPTHTNNNKMTTFRSEIQMGLRNFTCIVIRVS